jgi:EAL domain-containing protein (putative c-di-GMP-specific phosphodiesterase class I)
MSQELGLFSLTEGVETKEQYDMLNEMGCNLFQGYYFAKPMPLDEFEKLIAKD